MNELERELRALLEEDARHAPIPLEPSLVLRRTRRRQVATVAIGLATAVALVAASIAGAAALLRSSERRTPIEPPDRFSPGSLEAVASQPISFHGLVADVDGALWSRYPGLTRFDPVTGSLRTFTIADDPAFPAFDVRAVAPAREGGVWLLSDEQTVSRFDGDRFLEITAPAPVLIWDIAEGPDGTVWACGDGGVLHWQDGSWTQITTEGRPSTWAGAIALDPSGNVWVANHTEPDAPGEPASLGISRFDGVTWTTYPEDELFPPDLVTAEGWPRGGIGVIVPVSAGDVWVGGGGAVAHFVDGAWTSYGSAELGLATVASIAVTDGEVWIAGGFPLGGSPAIARFDGTTWTPVSDGLEGSGHEPVELTSEGGAAEYTKVVAGRGEIWATTWAALYRSDGSRWLRVPVDERPPEMGAIAAAGAGELWMTDAPWDGVWRLQGNRWTHIGDTGGDPPDCRDLLATADGSVWAWGSGGLASFDGTGWELLDTEEHATLALGPDGEAWTATTPEGDPGQPGSIVGPVGGTPIPDPAPVYPVGSLVVASDGDVWIGSSGPGWGSPGIPGLAHYDGIGWTPVTPVEGKPDFYVYDIELDPSGEVWVSLGPWDPSAPDGPTEYLVARFDGSTWRTYGDAEGVPFDVSAGWAMQLEPAPGATMLLVTGRGLFEFRDDAWTLLQEGTFYEVSVAPDGTVWLAGDGLFRLANDSLGRSTRAGP
ncbi:MAG: hypothetical protein AB1551_07085 [Actinomycetota bacterium]